MARLRKWSLIAILVAAFIMVFAIVAQASVIDYWTWLILCIVQDTGRNLLDWWANR